MKQKQALLLDHVPEVLYGGAAGGGKSDWLLMEALKYVSMPGYAAILFRRTYTDLSLPGALMDRAEEWLGGSNAKWSDKEKTWHFPSGATLSFGYLENYRDHYRYQGPEFQFVGFDELTQFTERQYRYLFSRLRRLAGVQIPIRMRAASNPGGIGHEWVKNRFPILTPNTPKRVFIPARVDDNPHLDKEAYIASLGELDDVERARLLAGDWTIQSEGLVFSELHTCVADLQPINRARAYGGCDWGYRNPAALLAGVLDQDDVLWIVEEVYGSKMTMDGYVAGDELHNRQDLVARAMELQNRYRCEIWHCDPAEPRNIERFRRADLRALEADNRRMVGIAAVNARIRTGRLKVFKGCKNLIHEAGLYRWPTPEERRIVGEDPIEQDNHSCSALRYMVQGIDRRSEVRGAYQPESEPPPPPDFEKDYLTPVPQTRYRTVEEQFDNSEEARRLQSEHLHECGWESFGGANW
jgi:PBSX family phage terminase large subunit